MLKRILRTRAAFCSQQISKVSEIKGFDLTGIRRSIAHLSEIEDSVLVPSMENVLKFLHKKISYSELVERIKSLGLEDADSAAKSMMKVYSFLDSYRMGFLSTDITQLRMYQLKDFAGVNEPLNIAVERLMESMDERIFKLPDIGIPNPDLENEVNLFERQLKLEALSKEFSVQDFEKINANLIESMRYTNKGFMKSLMSTFQEEFKAVIEDEQVRLSNSHLSQSKTKEEEFARAFIGLNAEKISAITIIQFFNLVVHTIFRTHSQSKDEALDVKAVASFPLTGLTFRIINSLEQEIYYEKIINDKASDSEGKRRISRNFKLGIKKMVETLPNWVISKSLKGLTAHTKEQIALKLIFLLRVFLKFTAADGSLQPIFNIKQENTANRSVNLVVVNLEYYHNFSSKFITSGVFSHMAFALPLVYPPGAWQDVQLGGYYLLPSLAIKVEQNKSEFAAARSLNLKRVLSVLNYMGSQAWHIHGFGLKIVEEVWKNGGGMGSIPMRYDYEDETRSLDNFAFHLLESEKTNKADVQRRIQNRLDLVSLRADFSLKLQVARSLKNVQKIYFPQQMDFRGRLYPIPPHLNHMGADLSRGLLIFSNKKPLTKEGLRWLKIHVANKLGKDKLSFDDRVAYVENEMSTIAKYVENPLKHRDWLELEECWQAIVSMKELMNAMNSDFPEDYVCGLPLHLDGSCNGLQHYAAMGRDVSGAFEVNLVDRKLPGDLYSKVAELARIAIQAESEDANCPDQQMAIKILPYVKRKTVKQTVMTTVYGVTFFGAKLQVEKQLRIQNLFTKEADYSAASVYLAKHTLKAVEDLFTGAHKIKSWLVKSARKITETNSPVSWITPLGLPVVQSYFKDPLNESQNAVDESLKYMLNETEDVNRTRQASAFPPNFVHSLDSAHLMLTAEQMNIRGLNMASVHDSYWTLPADVPTMNRLLREQFIALHSLPLLENLRESFVKRYPDISFDEVPPKGAFDLNKVLESTYFFS